MIYLTDGGKVFKSAPFRQRGEYLNKLLYEWIRKIKRKITFWELIKVELNGEHDITEKVIQLEKALSIRIKSLISILFHIGKSKLAYAILFYAKKDQLMVLSWSSTRLDYPVLLFLMSDSPSCCITCKKASVTCGSNCLPLFS